MDTVANKSTSNSLKDSQGKILSSPFPSVKAPPGSYVDFAFNSFQKLSQKVAIIDPESQRQLTFEELKRQTKAVASALAKRGFKKGEIVCMVGTHCLENVPLFLGTMAVGGCVYLLKAASDDEELVYQLNFIAPRFVAVTTDVIDKVLMAIEKSNAEIEDTYVVGGSVPGCLNVADLINDKGDESPLGKIEIDPLNDMALILQTSGTTGMSKNVVMTHEKMKYYILLVEAALPIEKANDVVLANVPFAHSMSIGMIFGGCLLSGCTIILCNGGINTKYMTRLIDEYKITRLFLTPISAATLAKSTDFKEANLSSLTAATIGGATMSELKENRCLEIFREKLPNFKCYQIYGSTEAGVVSSRPPYKNFEDKSGSVGVPYPCVEIKVIQLDDPNTLCSANEYGEVLLRSPVLMKGYFHNDEATEAAFLDGWYRTGDCGRYDEDGFLYVIDRISDIIRHKDGLIVPSDLELVINSHPRVDDCIVLGVPHPQMGEVARAFVIPNEGFSDEELQGFVKDRLKPHEQLFGGVEIIKSIPKSPAGKLLRRRLK